MLHACTSQLLSAQQSFVPNFLGVLLFVRDDEVVGERFCPTEVFGGFCLVELFCKCICGCSAYVIRIIVASLDFLGSLGLAGIVLQLITAPAHQVPFPQRGV